MPVLNVLGKVVVTPNYDYSEKYWPILTDHVKKKYNADHIKDSETVLSLLKECFKIWEDCFMNLITKQNRASFYIFVHNYNENLCELWGKKLNGVELPIDSTQLAISRRLYKIIIEQGCGNDLVGCPSFIKEAYDRRVEYKEYLEELLYIGSMALDFSECFTMERLFPNSISMQVIDNVLNLLLEPYHKQLADEFRKDIPNHDEDVAVGNNIVEFRRVWKEGVGINYDELGSIVKSEYKGLDTRWGVLLEQDVIDKICYVSKYDRSIVESFYKGLTVSADNKMTFEGCIIRNQEINRYICRPIVKLKIDGNNYWMVALCKWQESITVLNYNYFPFGVYPGEWKIFPSVVDFMKHANSTHDLVLENEVVLLLNERGIKHDHKVDSVKTCGHDNIRIDKIKDVGEIDLLILFQDTKIIYVCECKHNRSRFDMPGWQRDYTKFKTDHEQQLQNKLEWSKENINNLLCHFEKKYDFVINDKDGYKVEGVFIINAPTLYMFDCIYPVFTLYTLKALFDRTWRPVEYMLNKMHVKQPYFQNLRAQLNKTAPNN